MGGPTRSRRAPAEPAPRVAHAGLGPHWAGQRGDGSMTGYQASLRGGIVRVRLAGDRVILSGQAVTVLNAEMVE